MYYPNYGSDPIHLRDAQDQNKRVQVAFSSELLDKVIDKN